MGWQFSSSDDDGTVTKTAECSPTWRKRIQTEKDLGSREDPDTHEDVNVYCSRGQWHYLPHVKSIKQHFIDMDYLVSAHPCMFYLSYQPGFKPEEHKELLRDFQTRQVIFKGALIGALIGAGAAIAAQVLYLVFSIR